MDFDREFANAVRRNAVTFKITGMLGDDDRVFPLGTDTKVLSTIFELFCRPLVNEIAQANGYQVAESPQTVYPDFTLLRSDSDSRKIAIDVKTTYAQRMLVFTLGSYTSFLRNNTKNILYPYDQYAEHWIIGFVYARHATPGTRIYTLAQRRQLHAPYTSVEWFVQEKYKIAGERPGSGNTANIGSIRTGNLQDFRDGNGPFAVRGEAVFKDYWANYVGGDNRPYSNITEYVAWKRAHAASTRR